MAKIYLNWNVLSKSNRIINPLASAWGTVDTVIIYLSFSYSSSSSFSLAKGLLNIWEKALSFKTLRWAGIGLLFIVIERLRHGLLSPSGYWNEEEEEEDVWKERGIIGHRAAAAVDSVLSPEWLMMIQTAFSPRFPCEPPNLSRCIESRGLGEGRENNSICVLLFRFRKSDCSLVHQDSCSQRDDPCSFADEGGGWKARTVHHLGEGRQPLGARKSFIAFDTANLPASSQPSRQSAMSCFPCRGQQQFPRVINDNVGFWVAVLPNVTRTEPFK